MTVDSMKPGKSIERALGHFGAAPRATSSRFCSAARMASLGAAVLIGASEPALSRGSGTSPAEVCLAANQDLSLGTQLPRTAARLKSNEPLVIVAIGSSSTVGLWVYRSAATYPEVMRQELSRLRSSAEIQIINSGRIGDTISRTIGRFQRDVFYHKPDFVVWQLGTNDVVWGGSGDGLRDLVVQGVRALKAGEVDVILMDLQYAPWVRSSSHHTLMQAIIADTARVERVGLFSRFELMRRSVDAGLSTRALVSWDGLHNSAAGYECVGRALARAIDAAAR